jgi:stage II sporulation protein D
MSQVGAKGLAENGYTYRQILTHYFQGTEIQALS